MGDNIVSEILFMTTTDAAGGRSGDLERLLSSIELALSGRDWRMLLLVQRASSRADIAVGTPENVDVGIIATRVSASRARNILLHEARKRGLLAEAPLVAFPDDDCWYPKGSLERILTLFRIDQALDFWFCRYASAPQTPPRALNVEMRSPSVFQVAAKASSNTIFLRSRVIESIGGFDEELGVGTTNNGGEDTDYALRAFRQSQKCRFVDRALIGHRDNNPRLRSRYFRGSLIAIARHTVMRPASAALLLRKLMVGSILVVTRRMSFQEFGIAVRAALSVTKGRAYAPARPRSKGGPRGMTFSPSLLVVAALALHLPAPAPAVARPGDTVKIVTLGTSLSARGGWQEPLRRSLGACLDSDVAVVNLAKSGMTSEWGLTQIDKVVAERPDIVLVEFAVNDADVTEFMSLSRSSANIAAIVSRLSESETQPSVYVMAMNPVSGLRGMIRPFLGQYEEMHATVARKLGAGFIDHRPAWARLSDDELAKAIADGTHPDPAMASRVIVPGLVQTLAASGCGAAKKE
jgi:lysophospholipase L1-like esterase